MDLPERLFLGEKGWTVMLPPEEGCCEIYMKSVDSLWESLWQTVKRSSRLDVVVTHLLWGGNRKLAEVQVLFRCCLFAFSSWGIALGQDVRSLTGRVKQQPLFGGSWKPLTLGKFLGIRVGWPVPCCALTSCRSAGWSSTHFPRGPSSWFVMMLQPQDGLPRGCSLRWTGRHASWGHSPDCSPGRLLRYLGFSGPCDSCLSDCITIALFIMHLPRAEFCTRLRECTKWSRVRVLIHKNVHFC